MVDGQTDDQTVARQVVVSGRVQGVFFRASTRREARRRDVVGWVRNRDDGQVEAHLEGPASAVGEVEAWMRDGGPSRARVDQVRAEDVEPTSAGGFDVRH